MIGCMTSVCVYILTFLWIFRIMCINFFFLVSICRCVWIEQRWRPYSQTVSWPRGKVFESSLACLFVNIHSIIFQVSAGIFQVFLREASGWYILLLLLLLRMQIHISYKLRCQFYTMFSYQESVVYLCVFTLTWFYFSNFVFYYNVEENRHTCFALLLACISLYLEVLPSWPFTLPVVKCRS